MYDDDSEENTLKRERQRQRQTDRQTDTDRERDRERHTQRETVTERLPLLLVYHLSRTKVSEHRKCWFPLSSDNDTYCF